MRNRRSKDESGNFSDRANAIIGQSYRDRKASNQYHDYYVDEPMELMAFIMKEMSGISRTKVKGLLAQKMVYVNHQITTQYNTPLSKGQLVQICNKSNRHELRNKFVRIVYEDAFLIVVEKAHGILTNGQMGLKQNTVKGVLDDYVKRTNRKMSVHTVHRLDRETSGLLLFAKRHDVQTAFVEHWKELVSDRRYIAVVEGMMEKDCGTVVSWLNDNKMFVSYSVPEDNGGKKAITNYKTLKRTDAFSLVELKLDTGRKNQIRVHMQDLKHPIVGDMKYGSGIDPIKRICLHAFRLEFTHPVTGEQLKFEIPYPPTFMKLLTN